MSRFDSGCSLYKKTRIEGGDVAGYENIKDANDNRTPDERRELAKKAGEASGAARRRKADFRKTLNMLLTAEIDSEEWKPVLEALGVECTLESALLMAQIKEAMKGNTKAAYFVAQYAGQSNMPEEDIQNRKADTELKQARKEAVKKQDDVDSTEAQIASYLDKLEEAMKDEPK